MFLLSSRPLADALKSLCNFLDAIFCFIGLILTYSEQYTVWIYVNLGGVLRYPRAHNYIYGIAFYFCTGRSVCDICIAHCFRICKSYCVHVYGPNMQTSVLYDRCESINRRLSWVIIWLGVLPIGLCLLQAAVTVCSYLFVCLLSPREQFLLTFWWRSTSLGCPSVRTARVSSTGTTLLKCFGFVSCLFLSPINMQIKYGKCHECRFL